MRLFTVVLAVDGLVLVEDAAQSTGSGRRPRGLRPRRSGAGAAVRAERLPAPVLRAQRALI